MVRYLGVEVEDALAISESVEMRRLGLIADIDGCLLCRQSCPLTLPVQCLILREQSCVLRLHHQEMTEHRAANTHSHGRYCAMGSGEKHLIAQH